MEKVLIFYIQNPKDSLKYKAAYFLIENMRGHYSYKDTISVNNHYNERDLFQTRKMNKTTNPLYLTDNQGLSMALSSPVADNHDDHYDIEDHLNELFSALSKARIPADGLFVNADAGFDSASFRDKCFEYGVIANNSY